MRTPASIASRRSPCASSAGWTLPACRISRPASAAGAPDIFTASSLSRTRKKSSRPRSRARNAGARTPSTWAGRQRHSEAALEREIAVDVSVTHRVADVVEAAPGGIDQPERGVPAEAGDELWEYVVPAVDPAAVAAAGAGAAVLTLDDHDVRLRREPLDRKCRPEAGEPAADDAHVGAFGGRQRHEFARLPARVAALPIHRRARRGAGPRVRGAQPILHPRSLLQPSRRRPRRRPVGSDCRASYSQKPGGSARSGCSRSKVSAASRVRTQS